MKILIAAIVLGFLAGRWSLTDKREPSAANLASSIKSEKSTLRVSEPIRCPPVVKCECKEKSCSSSVEAGATPAPELAIPLDAKPVSWNPKVFSNLDNFYSKRNDYITSTLGLSSGQLSGLKSIEHYYAKNFRSNLNWRKCDFYTYYGPQMIFETGAHCEDGGGFYCRANNCGTW